ncbi:MAG TPA: PTS fructose transporter subunit IIA [Polyangia bacterium]|jgi:mannose/fructose-specific phosphotransferase system component IIA|nr:PTS fructose transporter subunit IIA [Polyangia bacterium]
MAAAKEQTVGLVVVTHGGSGECLLAAAAGIVGELAAATAVGVSMAEDFDGIVRRVGRACDEVDSGLGVLILVDIHGSSPFQACLAMMDGTRLAEIVCGVNLPMLLKLATIDRRELRPGEMAELVRDVGRRSIRLGSELTGKVALHEEESR